MVGTFLLLKFISMFFFVWLLSPFSPRRACPHRLASTAAASRPDDEETDDDEDDAPAAEAAAAEVVVADEPFPSFVVFFPAASPAASAVFFSLSTAGAAGPPSAWVTVDVAFFLSASADALSSVVGDGPRTLQSVK